MSTDRETTRIVRAWLEEGVTALPDRVLDAVLDQVPATPQRRAWRPARMVRLVDTTRQRHALRAPRRYTPLNGLLKWAVAAVVVAVVGGLAFVVLQPKAPPAVGGPVAASPSAAPASVAAPSASSTSVATPATTAVGNAVAVSVGGRHTCAITREGGVKCWGHNFEGALGDGSNVDSSLPVDVLGLTSRVTMIAAGLLHTCALSSTGSVMCWGTNLRGQLGNGTVTNSSTAVAVVGMPDGVTSISAGAGWTCALTKAGGVKCWGRGLEGELGDGSHTPSSPPVDVIGLASGVTAISAGGLQTCALMVAGTVKCWGGNKFGGLGDGSTTDSAKPVEVTGLTNVIAIASGDAHVCALTSTGGVRCWGGNRDGELGDGSTTQSAIPVDVAGLASGVVAIATGATDDLNGGSAHSCALLVSGGVKCWGFNQQGQLGNGEKTKSSAPVDVLGLAGGVTAISAASNQSCALLTGGGLLCWGGNRDGELGNGTKTNSSVPVDVKGL